MPDESFTLIDAGRAVPVPARIAGGAIRLSRGALRTALGWELKQEGLCRDAVCIPVPPGSSLESPEGIDLAALAGLLGRPLVFDPAERAGYLGASPRDRGQTLASLEAPDFALPGLDGRLHRLSDHRGKKVFLVAYASW